MWERSSLWNRIVLVQIGIRIFRYQTHRNEFVYNVKDGQSEDESKDNPYGKISRWWYFWKHIPGNLLSCPIGNVRLDRVFVPSLKPNDLT